MKKIFLFSSHLWVFATEIPVLALLAAVIAVHDTAPTIVKYYPLEIVLGGLAVLIVVFFFRAILISKDEIRLIGRFTSRDRAFIEEGHKLVLTLADRKRMTVELYECTDAEPALPFASGVCGDINLFRAKTLGNKKSVRRILIYFGLTPEEADGLVKNPPEREITFETVAVRGEIKHDVVLFHIRMLQTL